VFGPSFAAGGGAAEIVPVDVIVPGCPPPPLAILHGLLLAVERKPPAHVATAETARAPA
jgi:Ni,Fe-hydrogenase III small subunit